MEDIIKLEQLDINEALRYMGCTKPVMSMAFEDIINQAHKQVLENIRPLYTYKVFDIKECGAGVEVLGTKLMLSGESVKAHLEGCNKAILMAATISIGVDRLIRMAQIQDMTYALALDSFASAAIEQVCDKVENIIKRDIQEGYLTFRFGVGYGDLPIKLQKDFLNVLNAPKLIGLNATASHMLIPSKSVTAVIGLSDKPVKQTSRGCVTCNMYESCQYRMKGGRCNG